MSRFRTAGASLPHLCCGSAPTPEPRCVHRAALPQALAKLIMAGVLIADVQPGPRCV